MGIVLKANFKTKIKTKLQNFDPANNNEDYHKEIFLEMFQSFPQFKAHVAAYIERNYCTVVNDEDHADPRSLFIFLKAYEVRQLNEWILIRRSRIWAG